MIALALIAAPVATIAAQGGIHVDVPPGLPLVEELSAGIAEGFRAGLALGPGPLETGAQAYASTAKGAALYVQWAVTRDEVAFPEPIVRAQIDDIQARAKHASLAEGAVEIVAFEEELAATHAGGRIEWRQRDNETRTLARVILFVDEGKRLHEARVECVLREDAVAEHRPVCERALASLAPSVKTLALGELPPPGAAAEAAAAPAAEDAPKLETPATMAPAGPGVVVPPPAPSAREGSGRSRFLLVVGGALVILAALALFWRRRRGAEGGDGGR